MNFRVVAFLVLLSAGAGAPAIGQSYAGYTDVGKNDLDRFIGSSLFGKYLNNIGIVSHVSATGDAIAVVGRRGELATLHTSMLGRKGMDLHAPELTISDIAYLSHSGRSRVPLRRGEITISRLTPRR
jgi:hypothetical protein